MYNRDYYLVTYKNYYKDNKEYYELFETQNRLGRA